MAQLALQPGFRVLDTNGNPLSGAKLYFYDAGTTDDRTVYTDSALSVAHAQPVVCDSGGLAPAIYVPEGLYRIKAFTSADVVISGFDFDNISGPIDTSALATTEAKPITAVSSITSTTTLTSSAAGTVVNANPGGGSFTVTLPAASIGNGKRITVRNIGETGSVTASAGANTIDGASSRVLDRQYQTETYISDGADWHVNDGVKVLKSLTVALTDAATISWDMRDGNDASVTLADNRTLDAPDNPIVGQEGALIVTQDGTGARTLAFNAAYKFANGVSQPISPAASDRTVYRYLVRGATDVLLQRVWPVAVPGVFEVAYEVPNNTAPSAATTGAWTKSPIATTVTDDFTGASLASSVITLPAGNYEAQAYHTLFMQNSGQVRIRNTTDAADVALSPVMSENVSLTQGYRQMMVPPTRFSITSEKTFELQYFQETGSSFGGTVPTTFGTPTRPAWIRFAKLA